MGNHPKGNQSWIFIGRSDAKAEAPVLWTPDAKRQLIGKDPEDGKYRRQEEKVMTEDEMVGSNHQLIGHEFQQSAGDGEGHGNLACCSPWGHKESDMTEQLNDNSLLIYLMCTPTLSSLFFAINSRGRIRCALPHFFSSSFFSFIFLILSHVSSFFFSIAFLFYLTYHHHYFLLYIQLFIFSDW